MLTIFPLLSFLGTFHLTALFTTSCLDSWFHHGWKKKRERERPKTKVREKWKNWHRRLRWRPPPCGILKDKWRKYRKKKWWVLSNVSFRSSTLRTDKWPLELATWWLVVILARAVLMDWSGWRSNWSEFVRDWEERNWDDQVETTLLKEGGGRIVEEEEGRTYCTGETLGIVFP